MFQRFKFRKEFLYPKAYEMYHGKGFEVVGVSFDNKLEAWKKGVNDLGLACFLLYFITRIKQKH